MSPNSLAGFKSYLEAQTGAASRPGSKPALPAITISRECGSGASTIARMVADALNAHRRNDGTPAWTIFDSNLVQHVLSEHALPQNAERFMPEDATPELRTAFEELLGLHPSQYALLQFTNESILRLAHTGHAIIVGRGGNIVTARMPNVVHIRLVAPLECRVREMRKVLGLNDADTLAHILQTDRARKRYLKRNFNALIDDPLAYHVTINTGRMSFEAAAHLISAGILHLINRTMADTGTRKSGYG